MKNIYIAASSQHVGKTTCTLGLISTLRKQGENVGYCKPVGQKHVDVNGEKVDKDTLLFSDLAGFNIDPRVHSPVIFWKGATIEFLENNISHNLENMILTAQTQLNQNHDRIIYEGTGHPGVGSVANLSNARVAKLLNASVIMVVEGGIGSTIDMLNMCLAIFREEDVPILGVIVNKVKPEKIDIVKKYVGKWIESKGLKLLGVIPYDKSLVFPLIYTIAISVKGKMEYFPEKVYSRVEGILAGSLFETDDLKTKERQLLVVSTRGLTKAIHKIDEIEQTENISTSRLSGIVLTGDGNISKYSKDYIKLHQIPVIRTQLDTYGSVIKINNVEVKINRSTPWKVKRAIELFENNINISEIM